MNEINFLPQSFLDAQNRRQRLFREVSILCGMVFIALALLAGQAGQVVSIRNLTAQKQEELEAAKLRSLEVAKLAQQQQAYKLILAVNDGLSMPLNPSDMLAVISQMLPQQMALTEIRFSADPPKLDLSALKQNCMTPTSKTSKKKSKVKYVPKVMKIQMMGLSPSDVDVANLVGSLSASPIFQNVNMRYSKTTQINKATAREFRLEMQMAMECIYQIIPPRNPRPRKFQTTQNSKLPSNSQSLSVKEVAHVN